MHQQHVSVRRVHGPKHHRRRSQRRGCLRRQLSPRPRGIDLERGAVRGHVLGPLPARVVVCAHAHLPPQLVRTRVGLHQPVGSPLDGLPHVPQLPGGAQLAAVLDGRPGEDGDGEGHGEAELDVVAGVVVATCEVHLGHVARTGERVSLFSLRNVQSFLA